MATLILLAGLANVLAIFIYLKKTSSMIIVMHIWWFGWLFISSLSLTGLYAPSEITVSLCITLLTSTTIGSVIHTTLARRLDVVPKYLLVADEHETSAKLESMLVKLLLSTAFPFILFFFIRFLFLIGAEPDVATYRSKVFGVGLGYSLLYRYPVVEAINQFVVEPITLAALFMGVASFVQYNRYRLLLLAAALLILHSVMMVGRFGFHYMATMLILAVTFKLAGEYPDKLRIIRRAGLVFLAIVAVTSVLTVFRSPVHAKGLKKVLTAYLIDYHTVSFSIFDSHMNDPGSILHLSSNGRSSLGPFERLVVRGLQLLGIDKDSQVDMNGLALSEGREVGQNAAGGKIYYNAFGSVLFSLYRDGKIFFIVAAGIVFGFFAAHFSESLRYKHAYGMTLLVSLSFIGIYGIFQPVLEGPVLLAVLVLVLMHKALKRTLSLTDMNSSHRGDPS